MNRGVSKGGGGEIREIEALKIYSHSDKSYPMAMRKDVTGLMKQQLNFTKGVGRGGKGITKKRQTT